MKEESRKEVRNYTRDIY